MHLRGGYQKEIYIHLKRPIPTQKRTLYIKNDVRKETGYVAPEDVVNLPELLVQVGGARDHGGVGFLVIHAQVILHQHFLMWVCIFIRMFKCM